MATFWRFYCELLPRFPVPASFSRLLVHTQFFPSPAARIPSESWRMFSPNMLHPRVSATQFKKLNLCKHYFHLNTYHIYICLHIHSCATLASSPPARTCTDPEIYEQIKLPNSAKKLRSRNHFFRNLMSATWHKKIHENPLTKKNSPNKWKYIHQHHQQ